MGVSVETLAILWAIWVVGGVIIAERTHQSPVTGAVLGLLLGPIGWAIVYFSRPKAPPPPTGTPQW